LSSDDLPGFYIPVKKGHHRSHNASMSSVKSDPSCVETIESSVDMMPPAVEEFEGVESGADCEEPSEAISADNDGDDDTLDGEEVEDDDDGWITPQSLAKSRVIPTVELGSELEAMPSVVAMSFDFAVQNVLLQMGLFIVSSSGMLIREARSYALRCSACFKITPSLEKKFCPNCGHQTLERAVVNVDGDGNKTYSLLRRRPISLKGTVFPLPRPRGGKYAHNPIIVDGQQTPQQRPSGRARIQVDVLSADFATRQSPFAVRDTTSRAAQLGFNSAVAGPGFGPKFYWERRNPNVVTKKRK